MIVAVWVDDIVFFSNDKKLCNQVKQALSQKFELRELGEINQLLGIRIERTANTISLDQSTYICSLLSKFEMNDCKPVATPMEINKKLEKPSPEEEITNVPYQELIGSLTWLSSCTRPDIAYATNKLAQFNNCHSQAHWIAAKRILRFLKGTSNLSLTFQKTREKLTGYADASWGADPTDRRSETGWVFVLAGAAVSWESRKQKAVALSTCEAEYMSLSSISKECQFLRALIQPIQVSDVPIIYCDNQAAAKLAENPMVTARSKHIDIQYHYIRDCVKEGTLKIEYIPTDQMVADVLTKGLPAPAHNLCSKGLGLQ